MARSTTSTGTLSFATLCAVVLLLLSLPLPTYSNADSERECSVVTKLTLADLSQEIFCSLLSCKLNMGDACYECHASDQLLEAPKSATFNYVEAHHEQHGV